MLFSIIIPAYNAELYIEKCLKSVFDQKCNDYEIIIVDDGSTDRTWDILCRFADKYSQMKLIHKENGGIGSAIEEALKIALGDYIVFIDSDDYVDSDMLQVLKKEILRSAYDIIQFGLVMVDEKDSVIRKEIPETEEIIGTEIILKEHFDKYPSPSLASRSFKRSLFENITVPKQSVGIDEALILQLMSRSQSMFSINNELYYVYIRSNSVSRSVYSIKKIEDYLKIYEFMISFASEHLLLYQDTIRIKYLKLLIGISSDLVRDRENTKRLCLKKIRRELKETYESVKFSRTYVLERKTFRCGVKLCLIHPKLYNFVRKIMGGNSNG